MAFRKRLRRKNRSLRLAHSSASGNADKGKTTDNEKPVLAGLSFGTGAIWIGLLLIAIAAFQSPFEGSVSGVLAQVLSGDSDWTDETRRRHRFAARDCAAARSVGLAPANRGQPGYFASHDADNDGVACEPWR